MTVVVVEVKRCRVADSKKKILLLELCYEFRKSARVDADSHQQQQVVFETRPKMPKAEAASAEVHNQTGMNGILRMLTVI